MYRKIMICLCIILFSSVMALAQDADNNTDADNKKTAADAKAAKTDTKADNRSDTRSDPKSDKDAKELSGMSIVGNDEAPKSLYIVPWKSSEIGVETTLDMMLNDTAMPVDRDVFKRQLEFYQISTEK